MVKRLPKYVTEFADRHGAVRVRFRRKGYQTHYFKAAFPSKAWWLEYDACLRDTARISIGEERTIPGSIAALVVRFYGSRSWGELQADTQNDYRLIIERVRRNLGDEPAKAMDYESADAILKKMADRPAAANRLRKLMGQVWDEGLRLGMVQSNPWRLTRAAKVSSGGYKPWTEADVAAYEKKWPIGTKQRLALALMLHTAQRRGDAVRLGPQHRQKGRLRFTQRKTGAEVDIPVKKELSEAIDAMPGGNLVYLVTDFGKPFSDAGFGNWFRDQCDAAGVTGVAAHGLRKLAAIRLAIAGSTHAEIKSWTGHKTDAEVSRYIAAANRALLADAASAKMANSNSRLATIYKKRR